MNPCLCVSPFICHYYCSLYCERTGTCHVIDIVVCQVRKLGSCYNISHTLVKLYLCITCSSCSFLSLIWSLVYRRAAAAVSLSAFHSSLTNPLTLNGAVLCSDPDAAFFSTTELADSGRENGYSAVCLAPFFFIPSTSPNQHGDSLKLTRGTRGVTSASGYRNVFLDRQRIVGNSVVRQLWCKSTRKQWFIVR